MPEIKEPARPSLDAIRQRIHRIRGLFQQQLDQGQWENAGLVVAQLEQLLPNDPLIYWMRAMLSIANGNLDDAKEELRRGLVRNPHHFDLHFQLARLHEQEDDLLNAYHGYARAEYVTANEAQRAAIRDALQRLKDLIKWQVRFGPTQFELVVPGKTTPVQFVYSVPALRRRKHLYDSLIQHLHPKTKTVLEIGCAEGTVARNLAALGLDVVGIDADSRFITAAVLLDMHARLRAPGQERRLRLLTQKITPEASGALVDDYDVIVFTPRASQVDEFGEDDWTLLLTNLTKAAGLQLFVCFMSAEDDAEHTGSMGKVERALLRVLATEGVSWTESPGDNVRGNRIFQIDTEDGPLSAASRAMIPQGLEVLASLSRVVEVELAKCRDIQAFGYVTPHWHPFVAQIEQYVDNPDVAYEESILREFYASFQPRNPYEQFFGMRGSPRPPMDQGWAPLPWTDVSSEFIRAERFETRAGGSHFHGPNTDEFGAAELGRLKAAYTMLKDQGYQPEIYPDGYIQGFFLKDGDDYRFIVTEGQHRIAALAVLGYDVVRCRLAPDSHLIDCVDIDRILTWPQVKRRLYKPDLARRIFRLFFESDPVRRLREWGLDVQPSDLGAGH